QRTASTTLGNSARKPSPVVLTIRPRCAATSGSISSRRCPRSRSCVPSSSAPIKREYPATSAARIAVRRRTEAIRVGQGKVTPTRNPPNPAPAVAPGGPGHPRARTPVVSRAGRDHHPALFARTEDRPCCASLAGYILPPPPPPFPPPCSGMLLLFAGE